MPDRRSVAEASAVGASNSSGAPPPDASATRRGTSSPSRGGSARPAAAPRPAGRGRATGPGRAGPTAPAASGRPPLDLPAAEALARARLVDLPARDVDLFVLRLRRWWPDLVAGLAAPYGTARTASDVLGPLVEVLARAYRERSEDLKRLDLARSLAPDWFQDPTMIGYVCYVDRFSGTLDRVTEHLGHLESLGVRYLHLMPLLRPRPGDSDGGYAVADYRAVDPRLGSIDDLEALCARLHERGISVCIDLVLNHTAAEHEWARRAAAGDDEASARYWVFPDRTMPDRYEATLPEVFPDFAPGNFTRLADGRWVWTTFNRFQWDLNWSNPTVFIEMLDTLLWLANRGVDIFRLDAIAFIWKRLGSNSQNEPQVHDLLTALRACARIAAPAIAFKAEAIVGKDQLAPYLGTGRRFGRECDLAYHNSLMVQFWSALATRDTRLMTHALREFPAKPPSAAWATYIRCHDDIGWAVADEDAAAVGLDGFAHRAFLSTFYAGEFPGSFARGERFQVNPATGDSRISGSLASLAGLEAALEMDDPVEIDRAIERILLGHALILAWDGVPLLYMGDEVGLLNDRSYRAEPDHAGDNRWIHRPAMDWTTVAAAADATTVGGRVLAGIRRLIAVRRQTVQLHAASPLEVVDTGSTAAFAFVRRHPIGSLVAVHNFTERTIELSSAVVAAHAGPDATDALRDGIALDASGAITLPPYAVQWWIAAEDPS